MNNPKKIISKPRNPGNLVQRGMTLIELMVVVAIISVLAMVALPVYLDFVTRAQVSEGMSLLGSARTNITEIWRTSGCSDASCLPTSNAEAGMEDVTTKYVSAMTVGASGVVTVVFSMPSLGSNNSLQLVPTVAGGTLTWECSIPASNGLISKHAPAACR